MKFKELVEKDINYISSIYYSELSHEEKSGLLANKFNVTKRTIRNWWNNLNLHEVSNNIPDQLVQAREKMIPEDVDIALVTCAQNKSVVHLEMLKNLEAYAEYLNSIGKKTKIVIIPSRYRNNTSPSEKAIKGEWWADEVEDYLHYSKLDFGDHLISADSRITATTANPLSGYEALAQDRNLILGHPRIHYATLPRLRGSLLRSMISTGSVTMKNYSASKAGEKGWIHHSYGFTIAEKGYQPRSVKVNLSGEFTDLIYNVKKGKVKQVKSIKGIVYGDIHHADLDLAKMSETKSLLNLLKPKVKVFHDVFDGDSVNHHERKNLFLKKLKIKEGRSDIKMEVNKALAFVDSNKSYVIDSNHDEFLDRHINETDWRKDIHNSEAYLEYARIQQTEDLRIHGNIFGYLVNSRTRSTYIPRNNSLKIGDYECGMHGHHGINGSRGSVKALSKLNEKSIIGHGHSPKIIDGCTMVGVSCRLDPYYVKGPSSWAHADALIHNSGKNQLVVYNDNYKISGLI